MKRVSQLDLCISRFKIVKNCSSNKTFRFLCSATDVIVEPRIQDCPRVC